MKIELNKLTGLLPWHITYCKKIIIGSIPVPDNTDGRTTVVIASFALESHEDGDYALARKAYKMMRESYKAAFKANAAKKRRSIPAKGPR